MNKKHPAKSKSMVDVRGPSGPLKETDRKKLELGDAMEHEHGQARENTEQDIESLDQGTKRTGRQSK